MTLTNRLSLFFLAMLALVLAGFSASLYLLARIHLHAQAEERLEAALNTLTAAAEVGPDGVEWEPGERQLTLGPAAFGGRLIWLVRDPEGRAVDSSVSPDAADLLSRAAEHLRDNPQPFGRVDWQGERWLFRERWVQAASQTPSPQPSADDAGRKYPRLFLLVGTSLEPVRATLRRLAGALAGLSAAVWLVALGAGRVVCRRALLPVSRMAAAARAMDATDVRQRLPAARTGDELEDLSRAFNGLLDRVEESFERQRRFTGEASHQLRTPLTAMLGQAEVALRRDRPAEEYRRVLGSVRQQAERLGQLVESLLFLARADAEARLPDRERVDLRDWLPAHLRTWADHPRGQDLVANGGGGEPACVEVHPVLLGELVNILLDNACKYSPPGKPIAVTAGPEGDAVELSVRDQGCGIDPEDLPHLFQPFFRSPAARRQGTEGLGLGLAVAKRIAEAFGGTLTAVSQAGQGSCFTLRLPRAP